MMHRIQDFLADETGPTTVEYAVILMLIFLAVIGTVQIIGFTTLLTTCRLLPTHKNVRAVT